MIPKFVDTLAWEQAQLLMQPVFIRVIDNIRKQLETSTWHGTYQDVQIWPDHVAPEMKARVSLLQQQLETATPEETEELNQLLKTLPHPIPGYQLCLRRLDQETCVDLWELCYQICFRNFSPPFELSTNQPVEIDTSLIEEETGEVDWQRLDEKAKRLIEQIFANLPA